MPPTKEEAARTLAEKHFAIEAGITHIFRLTREAAAETSPAEPIKLLEVNADTIPSGVMPLQFGAAPARGIFYPSVIVEVTPAEFQQIQAHELELPDGWVVGEELHKPVGAA